MQRLAGNSLSMSAAAAWLFFVMSKLEWRVDVDARLADECLSSPWRRVGSMNMEPCSASDAVCDEVVKSLGDAAKFDADSEVAIDEQSQIINLRIWL